MSIAALLPAALPAALAALAPVVFVVDADPFSRSALFPNYIGRVANNAQPMQMQMQMQKKNKLMQNAMNNVNAKQLTCWGEGENGTGLLFGQHEKC